MAKSESHWTFFSNYGHIYFTLAKEPDLTLREIADKVGITERSVHGIVQELEESGYIKREKQGRNNHYKVLPNKKLRHDLESHVSLDHLIKILSK